MRHIVPRVLIIEKNDGRSILNVESVEGFEITRSDDVLEVFTLISRVRPDLIIMDAIQGELSGYEILRRLKGFHKTEKIPVVLVAEIFEDVDPCRALEEGAIDFIIKPISVNLLKVKMRNYVNIYNNLLLLQELAIAAKEMNPNTGLPGNNTIRKQVMKALTKEEDYVVVYADIDNFKAFNDKYGFGNGDDIIKVTGEIITDAVQISDEESFVGHVGGDDFIFLVPLKDVYIVTDSIIKNFDKKVIEHYDESDANNGFIIAKNRRGQVQTFPIMTLSLAGVNLGEHRHDTRYERIADICAEVKGYAKKFDTSCFFMDRRGGK